MVNGLHLIKLNPTSHHDAVGGFFDCYNLNQKKPTLFFLQKIVQQFARLPYENISKIIKLNDHWNQPFAKIRLPEEVLEDHITRNLGGTCFSLTYFLQTILTQSGFECYPVMADMRAGKNIHCCLIVIIDSTKYLVDPGYLLTEPIEINPSKPKYYHSEFTGVELRSDVQSQSYGLFTFNKNDTKWRYRIQDRPTSAEEFLQHWLDSFQRNSMHGICLTKIVKDGMIYVHKNFMRETTFQGKKNINIKTNYHAVINERFGIDKQIIEQAQASLEENLGSNRRDWMNKSN